MHPNFKKQLLIKISWSAGLVVLIVAGIFVIAYDLSAKAQYIFKTRAEVNSRLDAVNQLALLKVSSAEARPFVEKLSRALPTEDSLLIISRDMENAAKRYGLGYIFKFVGGKKEISENLQAWDFQVNAQGSFQGIRNFMRDIELLPYFIAISDVNVASQDKEVFNSVIQGLIYFNG